MVDSIANEVAYPELFHMVQTSGVYSDSKLFADAVPLSSPEVANLAFLQERLLPEFDLSEFLERHFLLPSEAAQTSLEVDKQTVREHIDSLWTLLRRNPDPGNGSSSLIPLPYPYVVPGGRFREIYYWDSYFTMLGHVEDRGPELLSSMLDNFAYLIDQIGFIPNGNRSYFCTRSQPPVLSLMVELLAESEDSDQPYIKYLKYLEQEYLFWMDGAKTLEQEGQCVRRVIKIGDGYCNRYWDDSDKPRPESYLEDMSLAERSSRPDNELYREIRAACESGWDFTSRWFEEADNFASIHTTSVIPVDLNSLMYKLECVLAHSYEVASRFDEARSMSKRAETRRELIREYFFSKKEGFFTDLNLDDFSQRPVLSLAGVFPLFTGLATEGQARQVANCINQRFLRKGGWVTSLCYSKQQWDAPNGWAPLQWITYRGLRDYGYLDQAEAGAQKWVDNIRIVYQATGKLLEKYDVEELGNLAKGGEYTVQHGFGWTNGVLIKLMNDLEISSQDNSRNG